MLELETLDNPGRVQGEKHKLQSSCNPSKIKDQW